MSNKQYMVDAEALEQSIKSSGKKKGYLAERIGCSRQYFSQKLNNKADFTIEKYHGINGKRDSSMADPSTLARVEYVMQNYDEAFRGKQTQTQYQMADGSIAATVVFVKKIDGQYYVAEAVTDAKAEKK